MQTQLPLILLTNDDGIQSDGLWSTAEATLHLFCAPLDMAADR